MLFHNVRGLVVDSFKINVLIAIHMHDGAAVMRQRLLNHRMANYVMDAIVKRIAAMVPVTA